MKPFFQTLSEHRFISSYFYIEDLLLILFLILLLILQIIDLSLPAS